MSLPRVQKTMVWSERRESRPREVNMTSRNAKTRSGDQELKKKNDFLKQRHSCRNLSVIKTSNDSSQVTRQRDQSA